MNVKDVKKALMTNRIFISTHAQIRMQKRGYRKKDIIACIMSAYSTQQQFINGHRLRIVGFDADKLPMVVVVGKVKPNNYKIITVMPPIKKFKKAI